MMLMFTNLSIGDSYRCSYINPKH